MRDFDNWWKRLWRIDTALLGAAAVAGVAGAVLSGKFLGARAAETDARLRSRYELQSVVVAAADLAQGDPVDASRLAVRSMPRDFLPPDAVPAGRAGELIGGHMAIPVRRGTPVVSAALYRSSSQQRLSAVLTGDRRALTIPVDQVNSQAGNLQPGDRVDIYYSRSQAGDAVLVPLLQRIEVLAVGSTLPSASGAIAETDASFSTITLGLLAPEAAQVLLAQQSGSISVVLRSTSDAGLVSAGAMHARDLVRQKSSAARAVTESRIELLTGGTGDLVPMRSWLPSAPDKSGSSGDAS